MNFKIKKKNSERKNRLVTSKICKKNLAKF